MATKIRELAPEELRRTCDLSCFEFKSTAELPELTEIIGQERATRAINFGIDIPSYGYNIYALGPAGAGKTTTIKTFLERKASTEPVPDDWCYVNNFQDRYQPKAICLPPGGATELRDDVDELLRSVSEEIPRAFEGEDYEQHRARIGRELGEKRNAEFEKLEAYARERGFALLTTPMGLLIAPVVEGQVLTAEQYEQLPEEERKELDKYRPVLQDELGKTLRQVRELERGHKSKLRNLDEEIASFTIGHFFETLKEKYSQHGQVVEHLEAIKEDIIQKVDLFKTPPLGTGGETRSGAWPLAYPPHT